MEMNKTIIAPFDVTDTASIASRWTKWKRSLQLCLDVNSIALPSRKRSYLLHLAGPEVQDIFYNIEGHDAEVPVGSDVFAEAIRLLDAYFAPLNNVPYERWVFRKMVQLEDESVEKFIHRLRDQGRLCEYGVALDMRITEQVFDNCVFDALREAILKKKLMMVQEIAEKGRLIETVKRNREQMKKPLDEPQLNLVKRQGREEVCFRCGNEGHFANDKKCPAKSKTCDKCHIVGHFKRMCKTKAKFVKTPRKPKIQQVGKARDAVSDSSSECAEEVNSNNDVQHVYATGYDSETTTCFVGGIK